MSPAFAGAATDDFACAAIEHLESAAVANGESIPVGIPRHGPGEIPLCHGTGRNRGHCFSHRETPQHDGWPVVRAIGGPYDARAVGGESEAPQVGDIAAGHDELLG